MTLAGLAILARPLNAPRRRTESFFLGRYVCEKHKLRRRTRTSADQGGFDFAVTPGGRQWSDFQLAVFDFLERGTGSGRIDAVAGSGKSTTTEEGYKRLPRHINAKVFAFNRKIAKDMEARGVPAATFHSLGYRAVFEAFPKIEPKPDTRKLWKIMKDGMHDVLTPSALLSYAFWCRRAVGLAKNHGLDAIVQADDDTWLHLIQHYGLNFTPVKKGGTVTFEPERALRLAQELLARSNADTERMDFDDMLYWVAQKDLRLPRFDVAMIDEAQDTNPIQRNIARRILRDGGRLMAVGDNFQAVYGFRGASTEAMDEISRDFNCTALPLSICYRCGTSIVEHAQQWVHHIQAAPGAREGSVELRNQHPASWDPREAQPGDLIVCRTNAPLMRAAMRLVAGRLPVHVHGRDDLGAAMINAILGTEQDTIQPMLRQLRRNTEEEIAAAHGREATAQAVAAQDRCEAIELLAVECRTITELLDTIKEIFKEQKHAIQLASIHRAKGLEFKTVWWLRPTYAWIARMQDWELQQEQNLSYVATTRAQERLVIIEEQEEGRVRAPAKFDMGEVQAVDLPPYTDDADYMPRHDPDSPGESHD